MKDDNKIVKFALDVYETALKLIPMKKVIIFESNPEFSCNTYPVYRYLIDEKHIDDEYKIIWLVENKDKYKNVNLKNTEFIEYWKEESSFKKKHKYHCAVSSAKALIYCNRLLGKHRKKQFSLCLQHGMPLKRSNGSYCIEDDCDYSLCVSEFFGDYYSKDFQISKDKIIYMGFPRNDYLYTDRDIKKLLGIDNYDKVIMWLPTFRKHTSEKGEKFNIETTLTGIPTINTVDEIFRVDKFCRENNILLLLKPHPAQNISLDIQSELTNFKIISNDYLAENDIQLYELLGKTDALVSDYSSVYYDYILTDKPIGLTVDDLNEYIKARGFVYDNPMDILKGRYIKNTDELLLFLKSVCDGRDDLYEEKLVLKNKMHKIQSADSASMIGDFIISNIK